MNGWQSLEIPDSSGIGGDFTLLKPDEMEGWSRNPDAEAHAPSGNYEGVGDDNPYCA